VFEAKFMLPWSFSEEAAAENYMAQLQHNMWVTHLRSAVLSIITRGQVGGDHGAHGSAVPERPRLRREEILAVRAVWGGAAPDQAIRIVDMNSSNSWAEFAALFCSTKGAFIDHERAKSELKALMPEDAKEAIGHGVRGKRSKSGAVSFDVLATEAAHAPVE
jgi:hypothetical protein